MYEPRTYRRWVRAGDLRAVEIIEGESDLYICSSVDVEDAARRALAACRWQLQEYITLRPDFAESLEPVPVGPDAPPIVREMAEAAEAAGVGPMAAVAGAVAGFVGRAVSAESPEVIIENGGDIYMRSSQPRVIGLFAGRSPLSARLRLWIDPGSTPCGVCTSSATVGHSESFGAADAVTVVAPSAALADAVATAACNRVKSASDVQGTIEWARRIEGVAGLLIVIGRTLGAWGDIRLAPAGQ